MERGAVLDRPASYILNVRLPDRNKNVKNIFQTWPTPPTTCLMLEARRRKRRKRPNIRRNPTESPGSLRSLSAWGTPSATLTNDHQSMRGEESFITIDQVEVVRLHRDKAAQIQAKFNKVQVARWLDLSKNGQSVTWPGLA